MSRSTPTTLQVDGPFSNSVLVLPNAGDLDDPNGLSISVKGRDRATNAAELVKRWNCHPDLARELKALIEAHERLLVNSRITKRDAEAMREMLPHYTGSARAAVALAEAA